MSGLSFSETFREIFLTGMQLKFGLRNKHKIELKMEFKFGLNFDRLQNWSPAN